MNSNNTLSAMDLFGQAILDGFSGSKEPFYFIVDGDRKERSLDRYLRAASELNPLEKKLIRLAYGSILDVGCGTGNYIPVLNKKGKVTGIDISKVVIAVATEIGNEACIHANVFEYNPENKYDTITFLENNFGVATSDELVSVLIQKLKSLLIPSGQVLLIQRDIGDRKFVVNTITIEYKGQTADFDWAHSGQQYLKDHFMNEGFSFTEIDRKDLDGKGDWYLAKGTLYI